MTSSKGNHPVGASIIIVAAGRGTRAGGAIPKQYQRLGDEAVLTHVLRRFDSHAATGQIIVVIHPDDAEICTAVIPEDQHHNIALVAGGATRAQSVRAGLAKATGEFVLIHDAARPLVSHAVIDRVLAALTAHDAAAPALPVADSLWRGTDGKVTALQSRDGLFRAQTPQGFRRASIVAAHNAAPEDATDDVAVALAAGLHVQIVAGDHANFKITGPDDLARAAAQLTRAAPLTDVRTGNGYDVHRFGDGDHVWLCGVKVPHTRALQGHSDADVGMHAVTDAIYGALGMGDVGQHFPPSDPQWKGAASRIFLEHAVRLAASQGFAITHVDCTLVCEYPKIGPHQLAMKAAMATITGLDPTRISVKATTSERLGFTGRSEGIAAIATATLVSK